MDPSTSRAPTVARAYTSEFATGAAQDNSAHRPIIRPGLNARESSLKISYALWRGLPRLRLFRLPGEDAAPASSPASPAIAAFRDNLILP